MTQKNSSDQSKKGPGMLTFLTGMAAGAAAVFFSKKENRDKTKEAVDQAVEKAKEVGDDVVKQSKTVEQKAKKEANKIAAKVEKIKKKVDKRA